MSSPTYRQTASRAALTRASLRALVLVVVNAIERAGRV